MKALMYHYIRKENADLPYFRYLHVDDFEAQIDALTQDHVFITKDQFIDAIKTKTPIENGAVLTFDDGLHDHLRVSEILYERGMWGIFYIATGPYHKQQLLDVHRIHMLIGAFGGARILEFLQENLDEDMLSHDHVHEFHTMTYQRQHNDKATEQSKRILNYLISYNVRTQILTQMMETFFGDESALMQKFYLREQDIKTMHDQGMVIGSHSVSHPVFSKLNKHDQETEIRDSFAYLHSLTNNDGMKTFCYPYGGFHSFTNETENILKNEGCLFSFNVEQRDINSDDLSHRLQALPRYDCNQFAFGQASMGMKRPSELSENNQHE